MARLLGVLIALGCGLAACGVGDDGFTPPPGDGDEHITCTAELTMAGTFTAAATLDPTGGCQPAGTWNVTVTIASMGNCSAVPNKGTYVYQVVGVGHDQTITYQGASSGEDLQLQISASGAGECVGSFEHILANGSNFDQLQLHPRLPEPTAAVTELTVGGTGEYLLWDQHP
jgi:hypothetical protein